MIEKLIELIKTQQYLKVIFTIIGIVITFFLTRLVEFEKIKLKWPTKKDKPSKDKLNIGVSIKYNEKELSEKYTKELIRKIKMRIQEFNIHPYFKIIDISKKIKKEKIPNEYLKKKNINLIIFGEFSQDGLEKDNKNFYDFNWSIYYITHSTEKLRENLLKYIQRISYKIIKKEDFSFSSGDSFNKINNISNTLSNFSFLILGISLPTFYKFDKALLILETLFKQTANNSFKEIIKNQILAVLYFYIHYNREKYYKNDNYAIKNIPVHEKILIYDPKDYRSLGDLSTAYYKVGKIKKSIKCMEKAFNLNKKNIQIIINKAFYLIMDKKYQKALEFYKKSRNLKNTIDEQGLCEFLENEYEKTKETALIFSAGFAYYYYSGNKSVAYEKFKEFIKLSENIEPYKKMNKYAKDLLRKNQIKY